MRLPIFARLKAQTNTAEMLRRLEDNVASFALGLAGEKGVLRSILSVTGVGRVYSLSVTAPDDWVPLTTANGWTPNASYVNPAYRQRVDGEVVVRGVLQRNIAPAVGSAVLANLPAPDGTQPVVVTSDSGLAMADVSGTTSGTLTYYAGGIVRFSLSGVRYTAFNRTPPEWPSASQVRVRLGPDFPGEPQAVEVRDAVTSAGVHLGPCSCVWSATRDDGQWLVTLRRVNGLTPLAAYTLSLAILA